MNNKTSVQNIDNNFKINYPKFNFFESEKIKTNLTQRKDSMNDFMFNNIDNISIKSSLNSFMDKLDLSKEKNIRESDEIKIFSNLNNQRNLFDFEEDQNYIYEKITTHNEFETNNYTSIFNDLFDDDYVRKIEEFKDFSNINYDSLTENGI